MPPICLPPGALEMALCATICFSAAYKATKMISTTMATKPKPPVTVQPKTPPDDGGALVLERIAQKVEPPKMYQVVMLNDDFTPMEFVIEVLQHFFSKTREAATQIMLKIHLDGKGICGVFSRDVAATKVDQVTEAARKNGHPLQCVSEPIE